MKIQVPRDVRPYELVNSYRRFGGAKYPYLQRQRATNASSFLKAALRTNSEIQHTEIDTFKDENDPL
jgi:hypothetical protein